MGKIKCDLCGLRRYPPNIITVLIRPKTLHRHINICNWCAGSIQEALLQRKESLK